MSLLAAGLAALEQRREEVNALNVFRVADGDTGTTWWLTLQAALDELDRLADGGEGDPGEEIGRDEIVALGCARSAARRARQLGRDPLPADPGRRRGACIAPRAS